MRDVNHRWSPYFGDGILDGSIAIIAETPGQGDHDRHTQNAKNPDLTTPDSFATKRSQRNSDDTNSSNPVGGISFDLVSDRRIPREFFETVGGTFRKDLTDRNQIYYTNVKKCKDITTDDEDWKNDKGYIHCRSYITPELNLVNPDVVLPLGDHAANLTFHELDSEWTGKLKSEIPIDFENGLQPKPDQIRQVGEYYLIPSYHWSYVNQSGYSKKKYWNSLAEVVATVVA
jgi:uracil-DNA glycosylase